MRTLARAAASSLVLLCIALALVLYMGSRTISSDIAKREAAAAHIATAEAS